MKITDRQLLNETVPAGGDVVVRVDLSNFYPARGRTTLNLTTGDTLVAQRTVTLGVDEERTVYLRAVPNVPGEYELRLDGVRVGTVTVTEPSGSTGATTEPSTGSASGTATPTPGATATEWETPAGGSETAAAGANGGGAATPEPGAGDPSQTEIIVAAGMALLLLYGVGVAVYVVRKNPMDGFRFG